jgi:hypothetical protein
MEKSIALWALPTLSSSDVELLRMPVAETIQFHPGNSKVVSAVSRLLLPTRPLP